jgi:hypothetical protein
MFTEPYEESQPKMIFTMRASDSVLMLQTPPARELLERYGGTQASTTPEPVLAWLSNSLTKLLNQPQPGVDCPV